MGLKKFKVKHKSSKSVFDLLNKEYRDNQGSLGRDKKTKFTNSTYYFGKDKENMISVVRYDNGVEDIVVSGDKDKLDSLVRDLKTKLKGHATLVVAPAHGGCPISC